MRGWGAASVSSGGARWGGEVSGLDKKGGPRRGGAGSASRTAARKEPSVFGISEGSGWGADTGSSSGGFWSRSGLVTAAGAGGATGSDGFGLPRDTLEQVCR